MDETAKIDHAVMAHVAAHPEKWQEMIQSGLHPENAADCVLVSEVGGIVPLTVYEACSPLFDVYPELKAHLGKESIGRPNGHER